MPPLRLVPLLLVLAAQTASAENLIANGDFSAGAAHWKLRFADASQATLVINEGEASILVIEGGASRWTVNLEQTLSAPLLEGVSYVVSYDVRADAPHSIDVVLRGASGKILGAVYRVPISPQRRRETFTYTHKEASTEARLAFRLGGERTAVVIDNVVVEPAPASPAAAAPSPSP